MMNRQGLNKAISNKTQSMGGMNAMKTQAAKGMPTSMFYRPATSQNKARGTMSSATYSQIPNSMSGMGQPPLTSTSQNMGQQIARAPMGGMGQPPGGFGPSGGKGFAGGSGRMAM